MTSEIGKLSPLNNYEYSGKETFNTVCDVFSMPLRCILGGKSVTVLSNQANESSSLTTRVVVVAFSIIVIPVGAASVVFFAIKLTTWAWECKKIKKQSEQTTVILNQFKTAFQEKNYNDAAATFMQQPQIGNRADIYNSFVDSICYEIDAAKPWSNLEKSIAYCTQVDAQNLISRAVKVRLQEDLAKGLFSLTGEELLQFILNALPYKSVQSLDAYFKELFSSSLKIDCSQDSMLGISKMCLGDYLANFLTQKKKSLANDVLQKTLANAEQFPLRENLFYKKDWTSPLYFAFRSDMPKIIPAFQELQHIHKLPVINIENSSPSQIQEMLKESEEKLTDFLTCASNLEEKEYVANLIRLLKNVRGTSLEKIPDYIQELSQEIKKINACMETLSNASTNVCSFIEDKRKKGLVQYGTYIILMMTCLKMSNSI